MPSEANSKRAAQLLVAVGRTWPHGARAEVQVSADRIWELTARGAILEGKLEALSKALERFLAAGGGLHAELARNLEAATEATAGELRAQLAIYDEAYEKDLRAGRERIATHTREADECEKAFVEACAELEGYLRATSASRDA